MDITQWSLLLAGVALVVATPSFVQMIWGKPKIQVWFDRWETSGVKTITCRVRNEPIRDGILRALGVRRSPVVITASFQVYEQGTNRPVFNRIIPTIITHGGYDGQRMTLESSNTAVTIAIAQAHKQDGHVSLIQKDSDVHTLTPQAYYIWVDILADDRQTRAGRRFRVTTEYPFVDWE